MSETASSRSVNEQLAFLRHHLYGPRPEPWLVGECRQWWMLLQSQIRRRTPRPCTLSGRAGCPCTVEREGRINTITHLIRWVGMCYGVVYTTRRLVVMCPYQRRVRVRRSDDLSRLPGRPLC